MVFKDRLEAAWLLIPELEKYENENCVVLVIPRGGVPIGYEIAKRFQFPMDVLLTKKIGHPFSSEYAIGSVSPEGQVISEEHYEIPESYIDKETKRIRQSLIQRY